MSTISLRTNVDSFAAQNELSRTTNSVAQNFERLSSGLRINRASDDPAGLAVADSVGAEARIRTQAIINVNDSISALNVASASLNELSNILERLSELATQASNSTLSRTERVALDDEAVALTSEYNRIVDSTEFNDLTLFQAGGNALDTEAGTGSAGAIQFNIGDELSQRVGDGTFAPRITAAASGPVTLAAGDLNGDGIADIVSGQNSSDEVYVLIGNGDGTFEAQVTYTAADTATDFELVDLDNDNDLDIIQAANNDNEIAVLLNNGDGTFGATATYLAGTGEKFITTGDIDGDGDVDILTTAQSGDRFNVFLNNGGGTFAAVVPYTTDGQDPAGIALADFNNDGNLDVLVTLATDADTEIFFGNGDGTFGSSTNGPSGFTTPSVVRAGDFNHDNNADFAFIDNGGRFYSALGNGDGTFQTPVNINVGTGPDDLIMTDLNGDGYSDFVSASSTDLTVNVLMNNGDGTFANDVTYAGGISNILDIDVADINNDGVMDIVAANRNDNQYSMLLGYATSRVQLGVLDIATQASAQESLTKITALQDLVTLEQGALAAALNRHEHAASNLLIERDNLLEAEGRIRNVNVAEATAELVKDQVRQEAAVAVVSQANQQSNLALTLLASSL